VQRQRVRGAWCGPDQKALPALHPQRRGNRLYESGAAGIRSEQCDESRQGVRSVRYRHGLEGKTLDLPVGKAVCDGRNYAEHAKELNNPVPTSPILFMKPSTAIVALADGFAIPQDQGECHHELELAVLIGKPLKNASEAEVRNAILGYGIGLDLTLRDLQNRLKEKSHPWEVAKAFDGANPLSGFIAAAKIPRP